MEILSDAIFKGNVEFKGGSFTIYDKNGQIFHSDDSNKISVFNNSIEPYKITTGSIKLSCSVIKNNQFTYYLPPISSTSGSLSGTLALMSQTPNFFSKQLIAPADCTLFIVKPDCSSDGPQLSDTIISYRVERFWNSGVCTLIDGCFWENTDIDIMITNGNEYGGRAFIIRKAAGLEMTNASSTEQVPSYRLIVAYRGF